MIAARVRLKTISHVLFKRNEYKQGQAIDVFGYNWIPQSPLFGGLAFALNRVLKRPLDTLNRMHITSAPVCCKECGKPTFFTEKSLATCFEHGPTQPSTNIIYHSAPLFPATGQLKMISWDGKFTDNKRMSLRRIHPLAPGQTFSFLAYFDDDEAFGLFKNALRVLCHRVNGRHGMNVGLGWGKKMWGKTQAEASVFQAKKKGTIKNFEAWLQSPYTSPSGKPFTTSNVRCTPGTVVAHTQVRNIHYIPGSRNVRIFQEGSWVRVAEEITYYETDLQKMYIGFIKKTYDRKVAGEDVKAIEPSFLFFPHLQPHIQPQETPIHAGITPYNLDITHKKFNEVRKLAHEELVSQFRKLYEKDPSNAVKKFTEHVKRKAKRCVEKTEEAGVKAYNWKEIADALLLKTDKEWRRRCVFCGAQTKNIKNLFRLSWIFGYPRRIGQTQVTTSFWTDRIQGSKRIYGLCPACFYAATMYAGRKGFKKAKKIID